VVFRKNNVEKHLMLGSRDAKDAVWLKNHAGCPQNPAGRPFAPTRERRAEGEWPLHYGRAIEKLPGCKSRSHCCG